MKEETSFKLVSHIVLLLNATCVKMFVNLIILTIPRLQKYKNLVTSQSTINILEIDVVKHVLRQRLFTSLPKDKEFFWLVHKDFYSRLENFAMKILSRCHSICYRYIVLHMFLRPVCLSLPSLRALLS